MTQPILNDEQKLWTSWIHDRDPEAGDLLIKKYKPLVSYHVQRIGSGLPKNVSRDDLVSLGMMGLFDAIVEDLDLKNVLERDMGNLSGGELQRVAIAATVLREGDFYYFDEPTSWLDVRQRLNAVKVIRSLADAGKTVLVIEHDLLL